MTDREQEAVRAAEEALVQGELNAELGVPVTWPEVRHLHEVIRALLAAHRPTEPDEDVREALARAVDDALVSLSDTRNAASVVAAAILAWFHVIPHGADQDEDNWEYACHSHAIPGRWDEEPAMHMEVCPHVVRRRKASDWEPVTPRGEQP